MFFDDEVDYETAWQLRLHDAAIIHAMLVNADELEDYLQQEGGYSDE